MTPVPIDPHLLAKHLSGIGWTRGQMEDLLGLRLDGTVRIPPDAKSAIWDIIRFPVIARKMAEIKRWFPAAKLEAIR
jgi:hypothetical protein